MYMNATGGFDREIKKRNTQTLPPSPRKEKQKRGEGIVPFYDKKNEHGKVSIEVLLIRKICRLQIPPFFLVYPSSSPCNHPY